MGQMSITTQLSIRPRAFAAALLSTAAFAPLAYADNDGPQLLAPAPPADAEAVSQPTGQRTKKPKKHDERQSSLF